MSERLTYERLVALSERERRQRARDMKTAAMRQLPSGRTL